jgi:periplasmic divalent cation tolerance protein
VDGPIHSIYEWEGELHHEDEWVLWMKAPSQNWSKIEALVIDLHPDEIPAILAIPCVNSNERYASWLKESTKS